MCSVQDPSTHRCGSPEIDLQLFFPIVGPGSAPQVNLNDIPPGKRPPCGLPWGQSPLDDFYWFSPFQGYAIPCTRSMLEDMHVLDSATADPETKTYPELRRAYPTTALLEELEERRQMPSEDLENEAISSSNGSVPMLRRPLKTLPTTLILHDPHGQVSDNLQPIKYIRKSPAISSVKSGITAHLHVPAKAHLGKGHWSRSFNVELELLYPMFGPDETRRVGLAAKIPDADSQSRSHFRNETRLYEQFPAYLSEDWSGYALIPGVTTPQKLGPVTPIFFGMYEPADPGCALPPILLLENCGKPIEPDSLRTRHRVECWSLLQRLHHAGFVQGSFSIRNILVQPGPLHAHPDLRSMDEPSFRIIDFGRGSTYLDPEGKNFQQARAEEEHHARPELSLSTYFQKYRSTRVPTIPCPRVPK